MEICFMTTLYPFGKDRTHRYHHSTPAVGQGKPAVFVQGDCRNKSSPPLFFLVAGAGCGRLVAVAVCTLPRLAGNRALFFAIPALAAATVARFRFGEGLACRDGRTVFHLDGFGRRILRRLSKSCTDAKQTGQQYQNHLRLAHDLILPVLNFNRAGCTAIRATLQYRTAWKKKVGIASLLTAAGEMVPGPICLGNRTGIR